MNEIVLEQHQMIAALWHVIKEDVEHIVNDISRKYNFNVKVDKPFWKIWEETKTVLKTQQIYTKEAARIAVQNWLKGEIPNYRHQDIIDMKISLARKNFHITSISRYIERAKNIRCDIIHVRNLESYDAEDKYIIPLNGDLYHKIIPWLEKQYGYEYAIEET